MLAIRMQRTGRKGHAQYRMVVQDSRQTPTSGKTVAKLGHYNPHTKEHGIDLEKAKFYLDHGAQPSSRVAQLLSNNGVDMPDWVKLKPSKQSKIKNQDKLRRNQEPEPVEEVAEEPAAEAEAPAEEAPATEEKAEEPATEKTEAEAEDKPAE